jgi:fatty-acyl-CoA synthase
MVDLGTLLGARADSGRIAVRCNGTAVSYGALNALAGGWAAWLRGRAAAGDRIATLCRAGTEQIALLHGCAATGTILVPLPYRLRPAELAVLLDDAAPALLLHDAEHADLAAAAADLAPHRPELLPLTTPGAAPAAGPRRPDPADPVLIVYTSGSAGRPRGVPLTHRMCVATGDALDAVARLGPDDVVLQLLPQYHVGGWTVLPLLALARGATLVVAPRFEAGQALRLVGEYGVTVLMGVPAMYRMMADAPEFGAVALDSVRLAIAGGAALPEPLARRWWSRGVPLCQGYGLTEAGPNVLCVPPGEVLDSAGWAGVPYPGVEVALAGVTGPGRGELLVRGPGVFTGYWGVPGDPLADGWLHTGDLAERDDRGWYRIVDRIDDMYVSGGENVAPAEIERVLREHPAVADAAVIGVPDQRWGMAGVAFVVPATTVDGAAIRAYCRDRLADFKVPARVVVVDRLPATGLGKTRRDELRRMAGAGR